MAGLRSFDIFKKVPDTEDAKLSAWLWQALMLLDKPMTWGEFMIWCRDYGIDHNNLIPERETDDDDEERPSFNAIWAKWVMSEAKRLFDLDFTYEFEDRPST